MIGNVSDLQILLDLTDGSKDAILNILWRAADSAVKAYCGQAFEQNTYTEYYTGTGAYELILNQGPVQSVTSVNSDPNGNYGDGANSPFGSTTLLTLGQDYDLDRDWFPPQPAGVNPTGSWSKSRILYRVGTVWEIVPTTRQPMRLSPQQRVIPGNIKVVYVAGYPAYLMPYDVKEAVCQIATQMYRTRKFGGVGIQSESLGDYSYTLANALLKTAPELGSTRQLLAKYREIVV